MAASDEHTAAGDNGMPPHADAEAEPSPAAPAPRTEAGHRLSARDIGRILPQAVVASADAGDDLAQALAPVIERAIVLQTRREKRGFADALVPVMGSAVGRAASSAVRQLFLKLNRFVLLHLSPRGLAWRWEAVHTNQRFADVVRKHSFVCPVKQVFLIHRQTGLLLQQIQAPDFIHQDGDMVSGMLTAVQDFVHDSFRVNEGDRLETIRVGDLTLWIEQGPQAILAVAVRGSAPEELRHVFQATLNAIHLEFYREFEDFAGDTSKFRESVPYLESFLHTQTPSGREKILPLTWALALAPVVALAAWVSVRAVEGARWRAFVERVSARPGLVVLDEGRRGRGFFVRGLRDPLAPDPAAVMKECGLDPARVAAAWEPYQALDPELTQARAEGLLEPPPSVTLRFADGVLAAEGEATQAWAERARGLARGLAGVRDFRIDRLLISDAAENRLWQEYVQKVAALPGLVVTDQGKRDDRFFVSGLKDPMANDPVALLKELGLSPDFVDSRWEPYQAVDPELTLARAIYVLEPPVTVSLKVQNGVLVARGTAPHSWIMEARTLARNLTGVSVFRTDELTDEDMKQLDAARADIEGRVFQFLGGAVPTLWPGQRTDLTTVVETVKRLKRCADRMGRSFVIEIRGYTEPTDDAQTDQKTSELLATRFLENLKTQGLDAALFVTKGMGSAASGAKPPAAKDPARNYHVCLKVVDADR